VIKRCCSANQKFVVLIAADSDRVASPDLTGWDEPPSPVFHHHKQNIEAAPVELLDHTVPALVAP
jgi:hypothetical protein